jgi:thiamine transport system permease protein
MTTPFDPKVSNVRRAALQPALWLWAAPLLFLSIFFFYPLASIFRLAVDAAVLKGLSVNLFQKAWHPLVFTVWQAFLSMLLTMLVGLPAAYVFGRYLFAGKRLLRVLTTLPFILPTVVVAAGFNALLGPRGWVNIVLMRGFGLADPPIQIMNTLGAILLAHVFYNTTVFIRILGSAWAQLDVRQEQAARVLGANPIRTFMQITLPLLRPAFLSAALLVFMFDFTSFGVILLLGGPQFSTLEVEVYLQALQMLNLPLAGLLSAIQLLCTFLLTVLYSRLNGQRSIPLAPRLRGEGQTHPQNWRQRLLVGCVVIVLLVLLVSPLVALGLRSITRLDAARGERGDVATGWTLDYYRELFINRRQSIFYVPPIAAMRNSLIYAVGTVGIALGLGILAATALSRPLRVNRWLDPLLMLPLGTSAVTLGLGFLLVFTHPPLDVRSFPALIPIAHSLVALPFVVRTLQPVIASIPVSLRQAATVLGASSFQVWREVDFPILGRALLSSAIFSFTISLGEFGATSFLARPEYPTLPIAIFRFLSQPGALNYGQALAMATLLMLVCAVSILLIERLQPEGGDFA